MDLNELAVFVRVIDSGSFTRAAIYLKQPKSRVSRRVAALEKRLGAPLLYRTTRQISLTQAGRILYENARQHIYLLESTPEIISEHSKEVAGILRLTAAEDLGSTLLGPLLAEADRLYPKLTFDLILSNDFVDLVQEGIDLAIRIGALEDTTLKVRSLGTLSMILVASPAYLKSARPLSKLVDLVRHPTLSFAPSEHESVWILQETASLRQETVKISPRVRSNNPKVLLDLALQGRGVALIPEFMCKDHLKSGDLKRVLHSYTAIPTPVQFIWPAHKDTSPKVRCIVELGVRRLRKYFSPGPIQFIAQNA